MKSFFYCRIFCLLASLAFPLFAHAEDTAAVYFAKQAGVIAGAAQACGQPISTMVMRSGEVIDAMKTSDQDKTYALAAFSQAQQVATKNEVQSQLVSCPQVINAYNNLPLMQPDYQEKVIGPLQKSMVKPAATPTPSPTVPAATTVPAPATATATPSAVPPSLPGNSGMPGQATLSTTNPFASTLNPGTAPAPTPTQNYVTGTAPINPAAITNNTDQTNSNNINMNSLTEAQRLQIAQQLIQTTQALVSNGSQTGFIPGTGVPGPNNPLNNSQLNEQLNGFGANNPIFNGNPLPPPQPMTKP